MSRGAYHYTDPNKYQCLKATVSRYLKGVELGTDHELELSLQYTDVLRDLFYEDFRRDRASILYKRNALFRHLVFSPIPIQTKWIHSGESVSTARQELFEILTTHHQVDEDACEALTEWILDYLDVPPHWYEPSWKWALACFNVFSEHTCMWTKLQAVCTVGCSIGVLLQLLDVYDSTQFEQGVRMLFSGFALGEVILRHVRADEVMGRSEGRIKGLICLLASGKAYLSWIQPYMHQSNRVDHLALVLSNFNITHSDDESRWPQRMTMPLSNSFPVPLGVNVSCIKPQEHIDTGEGYTFTVLPQTHNPTPLIIFEADASAQTSQEWRRMYGEYNERNLDTHNVLPVANQNYVFVHENHPVISLLKANADLLGTEINDDKRIDGEWFKVSKTVLSTCCNTLKSKVLNKIAFNNLMDFSVSLKRLDAKEWTQDSDILAEASLKSPNIIDQPCSFMARLEMTYELQS
jgi:hypothetical protein